MFYRTARFAGAAAVWASAAALANSPTQTTTDTFDGGVNIGAWSFFGDPENPNEVINQSGGNPGAWLSTTCEGLNCLDTFAPHLRTQRGVDSVFTGDFRSRDVKSLGADVRIDYVDFSAAERPLSLILASDNGTPDDGSDDFWVYTSSDEFVPTVDEGWGTFEYDVPAQSETLPEGWSVLAQAQKPSGDAAWNTAIENVVQTGFYIGEPDLVYIFQQWQCGADNLRITEAAPCPADFDGCGVVNAMDVAFLLGEWGRTDSPADLNDDDIVNSADLAILLGDWGPCG